MSKSRRTSDLVNSILVNPDNSVNIHEGTESPYFLLTTGATTTPEQGMLFWDADRQTAGLQMNGVEARLGQDNFWYVKNQSGSDILKGTVVMAVGALGASSRILVAPMVADGSVDAIYVLGITAEDILDGGDGFVMNIGKIRGIDTTQYGTQAGQVLYCDPAVPGGLTITQPDAPNLDIPIAFTVDYKSNGTLAVRVNPGYHIGELHDVYSNSPSNNDILLYNSTNSRWENTPLATAVPTPTLDQVTTAGNTTTNAVTVGNLVVNTTNQLVDFRSSSAIKAVFSNMNNPSPSYGTDGFAIHTGVYGTGLLATKNMSFNIVPDNNLYTGTGAAVFLSSGNFGSANAPNGLGVGAGIPYGTKFYVQSNSNAVIGTSTWIAQFNGLSSTQRVGIRNDGVFVVNTDALYIHENKNILIGTTTDAGYKLDVNGTARITSELIVQDIYIGKGGDDEETNTAVGYNALANNTVPYFGAGFRNTAFGYNALFSNTTGSRNTSVGRGAGESNTTGASNVFLGESSGQQNIIGSSNVYIGHGAGGVQDSSGNTYVGTSAGYSAAQGTGNSVYIGLLAGHATTGGDNVFLGNNAGFGSTKSDWLIIGNRNNPSLIEGNFATGNVMIGTSTDAGYKLDVNGTARVSSTLTANSFVKIGGTSSQFLKADGSVDTNTYLTSYTETQTLDDVTTLGNITTNAITVDKLTVSTGTTKGVVLGGTSIYEITNQTGYTQLGISPTSGNKAPVFLFYPSGTATASVMEFYHKSTLGIAERVIFKNNNGLLQLGGDAANIPIEFIGNNSAWMKIFATGNVGINTTTDAGYKLDVNGDTRLSGTSTLPTISDGVYLNAGSSNWKKEKFVRSLGLTGAATANSWVRLARVVNNGQWRAAAIKLKISSFRRDGDGTECIDGKYENDNGFPSSHEINWYSTDDFSNLISEVRSVRTYAVTTNNIYDIYIKIANGYMNDFTVEAEYWTSTTDSTTEITFPTDIASTTTPTSNYGQIILTQRNWKTNNDFITSNGFVKKGGLSSEFLKADGSVDSSLYLTSYTETDTLDSVTTRGNTTTNSITVGGLTVDTDTLVVDSSNNRVGIGISSPNEKLEVYESIDGGVSIEANNPNSGTSAYTRFIARSNAGAMNFFALSSNYAGSNQYLSDSGLFEAAAMSNGIGLSTTVDAPIRFWQANAEKARINTGGNFLIGTTTDSGYKLDVNGVTRTQGLLSLGTGTDSTAIGLNAISSASSSIAIGTNSESGGDNCVAIGNGSRTIWFNSIAIGLNSAANITAVGIGGGVTALNRSVAVGDTSYANKDSVAIGNIATTNTGEFAVAIGQDAQVFADYGVALGQDTRVNQIEGIAIGADAASSNGGIAIGRFSVASLSNAVAIGRSVTALYADGTTVNNFAIANYALLDFPDDIAAGGAGVPLGGVYHTGGTLKIRIT